MNSDKRGSILILGLWTLLFLTVITVVFISVARRQILLARKIEQREGLYDMSYSGMMMALDVMTSSYERDLTPGTDSLNDFWSDDPVLFGDVRMGRGMFSFEYDYPGDVPSGKRPRFGMVDEERKININYAGSGVLERLFVNSAGMEQDKAAKLAYEIIDWRDADDVLYNNTDNVSERESYGKSDIGYSPRNEMFSSPEEMLLVRGMDEGIFLKVRDFVTVFSNGRVNINTAPPAVLGALGFSGSLVRKIEAYRNGADMAEGSPDDNVFLSVNRISADIASQFPLAAEEQDEIVRITASGVLDVRSSNFRAVCTGTRDGKKTEGKLLCVFDRGGKVKYWGYSIQEGLR